MSRLLSAYRLGALTLKNRVVMPPMCMYKADIDACVNDFHLAHYAARAIGGVGLIIVEATAVEPRGRISMHDLGLWDDAHISGHAALVKQCHAYGAKAAVQLAHAGRKSTCAVSIPVAPSSLAFSPNAPFQRPHALSLDEIAEIKARFVQAALRAEKAGYDMVELHAAHGYLLFEFLSPLTNVRIDAYGGSFEKRCALVCEIAQAILQATHLGLIVRLSAEEWVQGGWTIRDSEALAQKLASIGVSMIHVSAGGNHEIQPLMPNLVPLYQAAYAKEIRAKASIPTIAVGLITRAEEGEMLLEEGFCDLVAYGRELLRNPNFLFYAAKAQGESSLIEPSYLRAF
ncbi:MAG: NADH:flavin oxidoreductase/NADH oxidase [Sulfurospirillum cavolei]|nr:NADH:flavin oxidoreductase/NADH oxidase [Sulfurospirillum cavolei]